MICNAEMECDNNIEVEISMAEQYDPDDQDDFLSSLGIDNLDKLIIPDSSVRPSRTDGGQGLAPPSVVGPTAPSPRDHDLQELDHLDSSRADVHPADFLTRPFHAIPKPKDTLLDRLRAKQTSPNVKVPSIHDPNYKFDFLADVDSVPLDNLPLVGNSMLLK